MAFVVMWPQPAQAPRDPHHWVWPGGALLGNKVCRFLSLFCGIEPAANSATVMTTVPEGHPCWEPAGYQPLLQAVR